MYRQINEFFIWSNFFTDKQSGYRSKRNCTTALIDVVEDICFSVLTGSFKSLWYYRPQNFMSQTYEFVHYWSICNYTYFLLFKRNNWICFFRRNVISCTAIRSDVPQGSVMGPFLFSVYVNDLPKVLKNCNIHMYADDVQLYTSCKKNNVSACADGINRELTLVYDWATKNNLRINPTKTKCILIYNK